MHIYRSLPHLRLLELYVLHELFPLNAGEKNHFK